MPLPLEVPSERRHQNLSKTLCSDNIYLQCLQKHPVIVWSTAVNLTSPLETTVLTSTDQGVAATVTKRQLCPPSATTENLPAGDGGMTQWVEHLLYEPEDLTSDPQHPHKSHLRWYAAVTPTLEKQDKQIPKTHRLAQSTSSSLGWDCFIN